MRHKKLKLSALFFLVFGLMGLQAQESINVAGGDASGSGGSASYSVGQVVSDSAKGANGSVLPGVQQPYEISVVLAIKEAKDVSISFAVFPNPTSDQIILDLKDSKLSNLGLKIYDGQGKLLQSEKITSTQTKITMSELKPSIYFVKVVQENKEVKTFKIIKN